MKMKVAIRLSCKRWESFHDWFYANVRQPYYMIVAYLKLANFLNKLIWNLEESNQKELHTITVWQKYT